MVTVILLDVEVAGSAIQVTNRLNPDGNIMQKWLVKKRTMSMKKTQVYSLLFIMEAYSDVINGLLIVVLVHI